MGLYREDVQGYTITAKGVVFRKRKRAVSEKKEITFKLTAKVRTKPNRFGENEQWEAAVFETTEGRLLGLHYCPCHDFFPYTPKALMDAIADGTCRKIICCFPADAKRRHPYLAPYIVGDWEGVTATGFGCGECEGCKESYEVIVREDAAYTAKHYLEIAIGIDHMGGKVPRYGPPLKKAA